MALDRFEFLEFGDQPAPQSTAQSESTDTDASMDWELKGVEVIGEYGTAAGQFNYPAGISTDIAGNLYVADRFNHRVQRITAGGQVLVFGPQGPVNVPFEEPVAVAVSPSGEIICVAEARNGIIHCFYSSGQLIKRLTGFHNPKALALADNQILWVTDPAAGRLIQMNVQTGTVFRVLGRESGLSAPCALATGAQDVLLCSDTYTNQIFQIIQNGMNVRVAALNTRPLNSPGGLAITSSGMLVVVETEDAEVLVLDRNGLGLAIYQGKPGQTNSLSKPIAAAPASGDSVYVADCVGHFVLRLQLTRARKTAEEIDNL